MVRRGFALIVVVMLIAGGFLATSANAKDAKGCDGLDDYRADMFEVGRDYLKARAEKGIDSDRDLLTFSSDDWTQLSVLALEYQKDLKDVDAPEFAQPWHQLQIEGVGLLEQIAKAASTDGVFIVLGFTDQIDANEKGRDAAIADIAQTCGDFSAFVHDWDAIDGDIDGTPVATPTD